MRPLHQPGDRRGLLVYQLVLILLAIAVIALVVTCYSRRRVAATSPPARPTSPTPAGAPPGQGASAGAGVLDMPVKPKPVEITFEGCPPEGDNPRMAALNRLKNRVDEGGYRAVPFDSIVALRWPAPRVERAWTAAERAYVTRYQGIPVAVEGYLAGAKESGPESPNCHGADPKYQDWHVWLTKAPGEDRTRSIVVETTPRVRINHPAWTLAALRRSVRNQERVRVSGWLMFDPEHPDQLGRTRGTLWEIHPIMRIDVQRRGGWVSLDSLSRAH